MFCKYCGNALSDVAVFCTKCGKPVAGSYKDASQKSIPVPKVNIQNSNHHTQASSHYSTSQRPIPNSQHQSSVQKPAPNVHHGSCVQKPDSGTCHCSAHTQNAAQCKPYVSNIPKPAQQNPYANQNRKPMQQNTYPAKSQTPIKTNPYAAKPQTPQQNIPQNPPQMPTHQAYAQQVPTPSAPEPPVQFVGAVPMKLYMPSKASFINYKFDVKDERGNLKYTVCSGAEGFNGYRVTMVDLSGREIVLVKQKHQATFTAVNFEAYINGQFVTDLMHKATFSRYYYELPQLGLKAIGDFINCRYTVVDQNGNEWAKISKRVMSWGDNYEIDIADSRNELLILATTFAVQMMVATLRRRRRM